MLLYLVACVLLRAWSSSDSQDSPVSSTDRPRAACASAAPDSTSLACSGKILPERQVSPLAVPGTYQGDKFAQRIDKAIASVAPRH